MRIPMLSIVVTGALAALAQPALATDYCVAPNFGCGGNNVLTLQSALVSAGAVAGADRIFLGATTYSAPVATGYSYNQSGDPVEIIGAGRTNTTITSPAGGSGKVLGIFGGPGTAIRDLRVTIPPNAANGIDGIHTDGTVSNVRVQEATPNTNLTIGVALSAGALESSEVDLPKSHTTIGVSTEGKAAVRDSLVSGSNAFVSSADTTIERTRLTGSAFGLDAGKGLTQIRSSFIDTTPGSGAVGITAYSGNGPATKVIVDGVTMDAQNNGTAIAANTSYAPSQNVDVVVDNTVIRGYATKFDALALAAGRAHIAASYSDYHPGANVLQGPGASVSESNISDVGNAGFDPAADIWLPLASSPLIDAGDPAEPQGTDYFGHPLVADGNNDGVARRDIGAFELAAADPAPAPADSTPPADPFSPANAAAPTDTRAPVVSAFRLTRKRTRFTFKLTEAAKVVVDIRRAHARRTLGKLARNAATGANSLRVSRRVSAALKPGRYTAVIRATDAAGNHSTAKRLSFRVA